MTSFTRIKTIVREKDDLIFPVNTFSFLCA